MVTLHMEELFAHGTEATDAARWRLRVKDGRQTWHYLTDDTELAKCPQSIVDQYWLGTLQDSAVPNYDCAKTPREAAEIGFEFFRLLQTEDGHWAGEYGGPLFLIPGLVISMYVCQVPVPDPWRIELVRYLRHHQNANGGWGLHIEGDSIMLCTATNYAAMRLLGVSASDPDIVRARAWIQQHGGASGIPSWGKFWLSVLNVYEWEGQNPLIPELWVLPYWVPVHPGRMWCHVRQIYLPMSYCYAHRIKAPECELIRQMRSELYPCEYDCVDWKRARNEVTPVDCYAPHHQLLDVANVVMNLFERFHSKRLRDYALREVLDHVRADDDNTQCISIGPISKVINMLVMWHAEGPSSQHFKDHVDRIADYLWMADDGMRMQGTNGSQLWDTALAVVGLVDAGIAQMPRFQENMIRALEFLDDTQIKENTKNHEKYYRQMSKGAFPFSTRDCGWTVSDCTSEGLKAVMMLQSLP